MKCFVELLVVKVYIIFFVTQVIRAQDPTISVQPANTAGNTGSTVTLNCKWDNRGGGQVIWRHFITPGVSGGTTITRDSNVILGQNKYGLTANPASGEFNLQIKSLADSDVGEYSCATQLGNLNVYGLYVLRVDHAQLNVSYNNEEKGVYVAENEPFKLICRVPFKSNMNNSIPWSPVLSWYDYNNQLLPSDDRTVGNTAQREATINQATVDMDGRQYRCNTKYGPAPPYSIKPDKPNEHHYATNAPTYTADNTISVTVHYGPRNVQFTGGVKESYIPGEKITATAAGKPAPQFVWTRLVGAGPDNVHSHELTITAAMEGSNSYQCNATNTLFNGYKMFDSKIVNFSVTVPTTTVPPTLPPTTAGMTTKEGGGASTSPGNSPNKDNPAALTSGAIAGIVIGVLIFLGLVIALIVFLMRRKSNVKKDTKPYQPNKQHGVDQVRQPQQTDLAYVPPGPGRQAPPPYSTNPGYDDDTRNRNAEGLVYADLQLDDTPRSRKPIQTSDLMLDQAGTGTDPGHTVYADIRRV